MEDLTSFMPAGNPPVMEGDHTAPAGSRGSWDTRCTTTAPTTRMRVATSIAWRLALGRQNAPARVQPRVQSGGPTPALALILALFGG